MGLLFRIRPIFQVKKMNEHVLNETTRIQSETEASLLRALQQLTETEEVGGLVIETLEDQNLRVQNIGEEAGRLNENLKRTKKLQDRFAAWRLSFGSYRKAKGDYTKEQKRKSPHLKNGPKNSDAGRKIRVVRPHPAFEEDVATSILLRKQWMEDSGEDTKLSKSEESKYEAIEAKDKMLDKHLDLVASQLDSLGAQVLCMREYSSEQADAIDDLAIKLEKAEKRQQIANYRAACLSCAR